MDAGKRTALETIIRESQRLRDLAKDAGEELLAYQLEMVVHEARASLLGCGGEPPSTVVPFKR